jgi:hypothetical protein
MTLPANSEEDYKDCRSRCFETLVTGLSSGEKEEAVRERYRNCLATCQRAKEIAEEA